MLYTGAKQDPQDLRDRQIDHILCAGQPFDWEKGYDIEKEIGMKIPIRNQGKTLSCVAQSVATYVWVKNVIEISKQLDKKGKVIELNKNMKSYLEKYIISVKAIYSQIFLLYGGAYIRDGVRVVKDWGSVRESSVPFVDDEHKIRDLSWKNKTIDKIAETLQASEYRMLRANDSIDAMAQAIRDNDGIVFGVSGENNGTWHSVFPKIGKKEWGHAIYGGKAKLIRGKKYIGFANSWGEIGEKGWQWIGEEWFANNLVFNPWLLVDKENKGLVWLIDKNGFERSFPFNWVRTLAYLIYSRNFKII